MDAEKNCIKKFVGLDRKHGCVSNIVFSRLTFTNFYKKITNKCYAEELALNKFLLSIL